jgi:hypothetical protein
VLGALTSGARAQQPSFTLLVRPARGQRHGYARGDSRERSGETSSSRERESGPENDKRPGSAEPSLCEVDNDAAAYLPFRAVFAAPVRALVDLPAVAFFVVVFLVVVLAISVTLLHRDGTP